MLLWFYVTEATTMGRELWDELEDYRNGISLLRSSLPLEGLIFVYVGMRHLKFDVDLNFEVFTQVARRGLVSHIKIEVKVNV